MTTTTTTTTTKSAEAPAMPIAARLEHCAKFTGLDAVRELLLEAAAAVRKRDAVIHQAAEALENTSPAAWASRVDSDTMKSIWRKHAEALVGLQELLAELQDRAHATQAEVTDAEIVAVMRDGNNCNYNDEAEHIQFARAILALHPERVPMTGEPWTDVLGSAGPDLLDLAKQWSDNKVHVYQVVHQAEKIVKAAVLRGITAQTKKETP